jgi:FlaA1/EpsC-like NDP-sugar epimerase
MGASKRLAEMVLQAFNHSQISRDAVHDKKRTAYSIVRFGNVLGSSGSVVPKFRQQIRDGGPVTLTHPEITRYFMTISEASQLVIQAGAMAQGGEVFVLDMGEPIKIIDLARRMIELSGLTVRDGDNHEGDIEIKITGLRPGEKLYEELLIGENPILTPHPRIMKAQEEFVPLDNLQDKLSELQTILSKNDVKKIRELLKLLVSGYLPNAEVVDWVTLEKSNFLTK